MSALPRAEAAPPDVYDGRALPRSRFEGEGADAPPDSWHPYDSPWLTLAGGLGMLWIAYYLHGSFAELASGDRESLRLHWAIALMYRTLGPSITVAGVGLAGAALTLSGVRRLFG